MTKNSAIRLMAAALGLSLLIAGPVAAKGKKGGGPTLSGCAAQLVIGSAGPQVLLQTADRKVDRAAVYQIELIQLPNGTVEEELILLFDAVIVRQPNGLYGALEPIEVEPGGHYQAQFIQVHPRKGDLVRCIAEFSAPDPGGTQLP